jgi:hypothetical protein
MKSKILNQQITTIESDNLTYIQKLVCKIFKINPVKEAFVSVFIEVDNDLIVTGQYVVTDLGFKFYVTFSSQRKINMTSTQKYSVFNSIGSHIIPIF